MRGDKSDIICKYHNTGFCKYGESCTYFHAQSVCDQMGCKGKTCRSRHPKACKYKQKCKRKSSCMYEHKVVTSHIQGQKVMNENIEFKTEVTRLKDELAGTKSKLEELSKEFESLKLKVVTKESIEELITQDVFNSLVNEHKKSQTHISNLENELIHVKGKIESNKSDIKTDSVSNVAKKKVKETKKHNLENFKCNVCHEKYVRNLDIEDHKFCATIYRWSDCNDCTDSRTDDTCQKSEFAKERHQWEHVTNKCKDCIFYCKNEKTFKNHKATHNKTNN